MRAGGTEPLLRRRRDHNFAIEMLDFWRKPSFLPQPRPFGAPIAAGIEDATC